VETGCGSGTSAATLGCENAITVDLHLASRRHRAEVLVFDVRLDATMHFNVSLTSMTSTSTIVPILREKKVSIIAIRDFVADDNVVHVLLEPEVNDVRFCGQRAPVRSEGHTKCAREIVGDAQVSEIHGASSAQAWQVQERNQWVRQFGRFQRSSFFSTWTEGIWPMEVDIVYAKLPDLTFERLTAHM
jgi:hypothetical protein